MAVIWTIWTLVNRDNSDSKLPIRLLIFYLLSISAIPTLVVMSDWDNFEAT